MGLGDVEPGLGLVAQGLLLAVGFGLLLQALLGGQGVGLGLGQPVGQVGIERSGMPGLQLCSWIGNRFGSRVGGQHGCQLGTEGMGLPVGLPPGQLLLQPGHVRLQGRNLVCCAFCHCAGSYIF